MVKLLGRICRSLNGTLARNIFLVGGITFFVKILGFFKETEIAAFFGLSTVLDTYFIAVLIPTFIQNVFIGALKNLFIPNYIIEEKSSGQTGAFQSLSITSIIGLVIILGFLAIGFSYFFLEAVFPGHEIEYYELVRLQTYIVLPCLLFWGISSFYSALLEMKNYFFLSNCAQFYQPLVTLGFLYFLKPFLGNFVLATSLLAGSIAVFIHLLFFVKRKGLLHLSKPKLNANMRNMIKQYTPKVTSGLLTGINPFVDQFFAAQLVVGSIAAINYGIKIPAFMVSITMIAIGNVLLPHFSRIINDNFNLALQQLKRILLITFIGAFMAAAIVFLTSETIVCLLFERRSFTAENTQVVSKIQMIYLVHVPFYLCTLITVNFLTAFNKNKFMAWVSFLNLVLNLIFNIIFVHVWGVYGLVLSTSLVYILASFLYVGFALRLKHPHKSIKA